MRSGLSTVLLLALLEVVPTSAAAQAPDLAAAQPAAAPVDVAAPASSALPSVVTPPSVAERDGHPWTEAPADGELRVIVTGDTGGFSSWRTEIRGPTELIPYFRTRPGTAVPESTGTSVYQSGGRLLFRELPWRVQDLRALLASEELRVEPVCEQLPVLHSEAEIDLQVDDQGCLQGEQRTALDALMDAIGGGPRPRGSGAHQEEASAGGASVVRLAWGQARLARVHGPAGLQAFLLELPGSSEARQLPLERDPDAWEHRLVVRSRVRIGDRWQRLLSVGLPTNEGSRRARYLADRRAEPSGAAALWIDAGGAVEGPSFLERDVNLDWPISWAAASRLRLDALVPGAEELHGGVARLSQEAATAGVPLVSANFVRQGEPVFERYLLRTHGPHLVGVIGLSDPDLPSALRPALLEGCTVTDPAPALDRALERMEEEAGRVPDLVIVIGKLGGATFQKLRSSLLGVDLVLLAGLGAEEAAWPLQLRRPPGATRRARGRDREPVLVRAISRLGPEEITVRLAKGPPGDPAPVAELTVRPRRVTAAWPADAEVLRAVQHIRHTVYDRGDEPLLPDLDPLIKGSPTLVKRLLADPEYRALTDDEGPEGLASVPAMLTPRLWSQLAAGSLRRALAADVALVEELDMVWRSVGAVPRIVCQANLAGTADVVLVDLPGALLKQVSAGTLGLGGLAISGASDGWTLVAGRPLRAEEWYRVAVSEVVWSRPAFVDLLARAKVERSRAATRFVADGAGYRPAARGDSLSLRSVVLGTLDARRERDPALGPASRPTLLEDLGDGSAGKPTRVYLDVRELTASAEAYLQPGVSVEETSGEPHYARVGETRVQTRSNVRQAYRGDATLMLDAAAVSWLLRGFVQFDRYDFHDSNTEEETVDDLLAETELRVGAWGTALPRGLSLMPAAKLTFDTEVTRLPDSERSTEDHEVLQPRQKLLRGSFGGVGLGSGALKMARVGAVLQRDLVAAKTELGLGVELDHRLPLGPLLWTNTADARWFLPNESGDSEADLGLRVAGRSALRVPFLRDLAFVAYVDVFLFQGKVESTRDFGVSTILGAGLSYARLWKPGREPLF